MEQRKAAAEQQHQGLPTDNSAAEGVGLCFPTANPEPQAIQQPAVMLILSSQEN